VAIYALAFGDGAASLAGKAIGGPKIPRLGSKTFTGSFACLTVVFMTTLGLTQKPMESLLIAFTAAFLEAIPLGNYDNLVIPFGVGMVAAKFLFP
jgi:phytol kinase